MDTAPKGADLVLEDNEDMLVRPVVRTIRGGGNGSKKMEEACWRRGRRLRGRW
jgi:hypothetical protein